VSYQQLASNALLVRTSVFGAAAYDTLSQCWNCVYVCVCVPMRERTLCCFASHNWDTQEEQLQG